MTNKFINNDFSDIAFGRKSIRLYDENFKISQEEMLEMIQEATTTPSSVNMQPWRFVVVESEEAKAKLKPLIRFNTRQNDTSSAMVLIFGDMQCYEHGEEIYNCSRRTRENVRGGQRPTIGCHHSLLQELLERADE
jgi:nitroreductase